MATASKTRTATRRAAAPAARRVPTRRAPPVKKAAAQRPPKAAAKAAAKAKKPKLVRRSYSLTKADYDLLQSLKARATRAGHPTKKGDLLRAGIAVLAAMPDVGLLSTLAGVPSRKTLRAGA